MKTIMLVFGTRPEAVKMCPLALELQSHSDEVRTVLCVTGQHRGMLDPVLAAFGLAPDHDLDVFREGQTLFDITQGVLARLPDILEAERPDIVLVHGDTTTAFAAALACYYRRIPVGHVEAGLRTYDAFAPFPEEFNRHAVDVISRYHFAPTPECRKNLLREGIAENTVHVTGNTVIDALKTTVRPDFTHPALDGGRLVLVTAHRRESIGEPMRRMFRALRRVADEHPDVTALYPMHPNPAVRELARAELSGHARIWLVEPMDVPEFHNLLARCFFVLTDSGGIQEEAMALGKPVVVMREKTERPEGVAAGGLVLAGTEEDAIAEKCHELLASPAVYERMALAKNPYGDGAACGRIVSVLLEGGQS